MVAIQTKIEPEVCTYVDQEDNLLTIEIVLPDVSKENIKLKVNARSLLLFAAAEKVNYAKYISFYHPVIPDKVRATYEHGLLRITLPLRA